MDKGWRKISFYAISFILTKYNIKILKILYFEYQNIVFIKKILYLINLSKYCILLMYQNIVFIKKYCILLIYQNILFIKKYCILLYILLIYKGIIKLINLSKYCILNINLKFADLQKQFTKIHVVHAVSQNIFFLLHTMSPTLVNHTTSLLAQALYFARGDIFPGSNGCSYLRMVFGWSNGNINNLLFVPDMFYPAFNFVFPVIKIRTLFFGDSKVPCPWEVPFARFVWAKVTNLKL